MGRSCQDPAMGLESRSGMGPRGGGDEIAALEGPIKSDWLSASESTARSALQGPWQMLHWISGSSRSSQESAQMLALVRSGCWLETGRALG